mmetsp:Transcript_39421/g.156518  ORF Transcript_39421/g.156518 Transcript_39421/m.156518 type:complete len:101 (+) Transcript_39421:5020-5322(+)
MSSSEPLATSYTNPQSRNPLHSRKGSVPHVTTSGGVLHGVRPRSNLWTFFGVSVFLWTSSPKPSRSSLYIMTRVFEEEDEGELDNVQNLTGREGDGVFLF